MSSRIKLRKQQWSGRKQGPPTANLLAAAIKKHQEGQPEEAAKIYREILSSSPDHIDALHFLGVAEHQLGRSERALEHINRALEQMPDHPDALNNRGNILKKAGRLDEAERDYRRALELRPCDANTRNNLGTIQRERGDLEGAIATYREVIAAKPDHVPAWQNLGNTLGDLNRLPEALDAHYEAMRLAPQSADSYRYLGRILYAEGRLEEATDIYRRWLAIFPDDPRAQHFAAACTGESVPSRASDAYVRAEFEGFASTFDGTLARLEYQAPKLVADEVARLYGQAEPRLAVLDAGCGTGLCGPLLRPRASFMAGIDLSDAMIELARKRSVYDALVVAELTTYLREHASTSDLIVSADTLVYFGDLGDVAAAAAKSLRPGGALVFTVERARPEDAPGGYRINPHGRYSHTSDYLLRVLARSGFVAPSLREVHLRKEAGLWVEGWLVSARTPTTDCQVPPPQKEPS
jgi:predicted TPR repeat methyltransferase